MKKENTKKKESITTNELNDKLETFVFSYLRGVLVFVGIITLGLGSMFFGDTVLGVGMIILLCGIFYHSFGGLVSKFLHLALASLLLVGATAHVGISKLASIVRDKLDNSQSKKKTVYKKAAAPEETTAPVDAAEATVEKEEEPVFKRVVLDGDVETDADKAEAEFAASMKQPMKPKFVDPSKLSTHPTEVVDTFSDEEEEAILMAGMEGDDETYMAPEADPEVLAIAEAQDAADNNSSFVISEDDIPAEKPSQEEIPDDVAIAALLETEAEVATPVPARAPVRPRKVSVNRLPNGARVVVRSSNG